MIVSTMVCYFPSVIMYTCRHRVKKSRLCGVRVRFAAFTAHTRLRTSPSRWPALAPITAVARLEPARAPRSAHPADAPPARAHRAPARAPTDALLANGTEPRVSQSA